MKPELAQFEREYAGKLQFVDVNVDDPTMSQKYGKYSGANAIPETVFVKGGNVVFRKVGAMRYADLVEAFKQARSK